MRAVTIRKQPLAGSHGLSDRDIDNRAQARVIFSHKRNRASHDRIFNRVYRLAFPSKIDPAPDMYLQKIPLPRKRCWTFPFPIGHQPGVAT